MIETWLTEVWKGIGGLFLNPLIYWFIILLFVVGYKRIKVERMDFGSKIFDILSESKGTWRTAFIAGIILSLVTLGSGMVFHYETILFISIVIIVLSITMRFSLLSPSYTIGISYLLLFFLPVLLDNQSTFIKGIVVDTNFSALSILLGLFLIVEAVLLRRIDRNETYPSLTRSDRGIWVGQHRLKKATIVPFFTLIPGGMIAPIEPIWPYLTIGGETYGLLLIPFIIGFDIPVRGRLPKEAAIKLSNYILLIGIVVTVGAIGSVFFHWLSLMVVVLAILAKEYLYYRFRNGEKLRAPFFHPATNRGIKILSIIPGTPGDRLDIWVGETIVKVNGMKINHAQDFYIGLQNSGAYFKLDVLDDNKEIRFIQGAFYEGDHHELGLVFTEKPHRKNLKKVD
ncbi:PDZ domain-containing protein [Oceanobacillus senegalensis]|uniref:PDZ domain-containing protein n=1 Tax=Oceanobacillus senegalensis TaxID=1936063 RepID=UPI000A310161|nr:PDZ domain-containing protein [Oceanobacillus senegalensis]